MTIFGLFITTAKKAAKDVEAAKKKNAFWNTVISKMLWENFKLRQALRAK